MSFFNSLFGKKKEIISETLNQWEGINEVESLREDGHIIYKSNRVSSLERQQIGIYGLKWYSNNNKYCVVYLSDNDVDYNIGLVETITKQILFKIKLDRPHRCRLTNEGLIVCEDWGQHNCNSSYIYLIDNTGKILLKKRHNSAIGNIFELIENETKFKYNLNYTGELKIIDLQKLINQNPM